MSAAETQPQIAQNLGAGLTFQQIGAPMGALSPNQALLEELRRKKLALKDFPTFQMEANEGGRISDLVSPENDRDTIPAMLTENENVVTRRAVLGLDLMNGGIGDFTRGHEILDNINRQGEDYLDTVLSRPLFNRGRYG